MTDKAIEVLIGKYLRLLGLKLALAESCTGGLVGHRITNVPGSSEYFLGGVTAYAYEAKVKLLGVSWDTLTRFGAVSCETVL
jgi:PncC family amidohydrolase